MKRTEELYARISEITKRVDEIIIDEDKDVEEIVSLMQESEDIERELLSRLDQLNKYH